MDWLILKFRRAWECLCDHLFEVIVGLIGLGVIFGFLAAKTYHGEALAAENAAHYGDFIGGFIGTILLVFTACLLIAAHKQHEKTEFSRSFETHFFEMLKYHRDNMREIDIEGITGRRAFVYFLREWRLALMVVSKAEKDSGIALDVRRRARLGYLAFLHGSGPNARKELRRDASKLSYKPELVESLIECMTIIWGNHSEGHPKYAQVRSWLSGALLSKDHRNILKESAKTLRYKPFGGHHSRLAHYFRHLHQLVDYVHAVAPAETRNRHVRLVTVQLSTHEQALLALHAYSIESGWNGSPHIDNYGLIGDVPEGFIPIDQFPIWEIYDRKRIRDHVPD